MTTLTIETAHRHTALPARLGGWLAAAWRTNKPLTAVGVVTVATLLVSLVGIVVDDRVITGQAAWIKPAKFSISVSIYAFTFLWMLQFVDGFRRVKTIIASVVALALAFEIVVILLQVLRGTTSHFNFATPLDAAIYSSMGTMITVVWVMTMVLAVLLFLRRGLDPAFAWALRFGVLAGVIGVGLAFQMTVPTAAQLDGAVAGQGLATIGAHSVGVADGGPGLPFVGWSTTGGDLRIPHFVGIHGMQVLPFIGWLLMLPAVTAGLRTGARVALAWIAGIGFIAMVALVNWQALRGQPLISPDPTTLMALAGLIGTVVTATAATLLIGRRHERPGQAPA